MRKILSNKFIKLILIPGLLLLFWLFLSLTYSSYKSLTVLIYPHSTSNYLQFPSGGNLTAGKKIEGEFVAQENNLGIIALKIDEVTGSNDSKDKFVFKVKEQGSKSWFYSQEYNAGTIRSNPVFPFGFPVVPQSKGKAYIFELVASKDNAYSLILSDNNPVFLTRYKFSKSDLLSPPKIVQFIYKKIYTLLINFDMLTTTSIFLVPFEFYILLIITSYFWRKLINVKRNFFEMAIILISVSILINYALFYILFFVFLALWIIAVRVNKFGPEASYYLAFFLIVASCFLAYLGLESFVAKSSIWSFFLILVGTVQILMTNNENLKEYSHKFRKIFLK